MAPLSFGLILIKNLKSNFRLSGGEQKTSVSGSKRIEHVAFVVENTFRCKLFGESSNCFCSGASKAANLRSARRKCSLY